MKFKKIILLFIALQFFYAVSNAQIKLVGNITTNGVASYPTHIDSLGRGGYMSLPTIADRDAIPNLRRKYGMLVFVQADGVIYKLNAATLANADWVALALGSSGTVTNVNALTLGTTGTDITSSVANGTTSPSITLNIPTASASNRGALSAADFTTFNAKQSALTFSTGLTNTSNTITVNTSQNIATLSNLTGNGIVTTTGGAGTLSILSTLTVANGGTGATTKSTAFDALSPMTTSGDIIYGGLSGTGTRLAKGTDGQILTLASGVPAWVATSSIGGSGTTNYITKFTAGTTLGNSLIFDNGTTVGIGTASPDATSVLDLTSTTKGMLAPRMTQVQKSAISSPATGLLIYQTDGTTGFYYYTGSAWIGLSSSGLLSKVEGTDFTGSLLVGHATTGILNAAERNTGIGLGALQAVTTGDDNTAIGYQALYSNTTGGYNTASGYQALYSHTGSYNTAYGYQALYYTTGIHNTASGYRALYNNTEGNYNTASGSYSLSSNTFGTNNTAFGTVALTENRDGEKNTAVGMYALYQNKAGSNATAIGHGAMYYANSTTTLFTNTNVAVGFEALRGGSTNALLNTGNGNTALGYQALRANTTGSSNTASGNQALFANTGGSYNTASGESAGNNITTGSNNTAIGYNAQVPTETADNQVRIGNTAVTYAGVQVAWTTTSDKRWKSDIKQSALGLDFIKSLNPVSYVRNNDEKKKTEYGFIAQELEIALNKASAANNGIISKDDAGMYSVRYNDLLAPMVKAIQEQQAQIDEQKKQIEELKLLILSMKK